MPPADLDPVVHEKLRRLPSPSAPATLLPRVMAAVHAWTLRPWYERAWFTWPAGWQAASIAALVALIVAGVLAVSMAQDTVPAFVAARVSAPAAAVAGAVKNVDALIAAARIVWRALAAPLVPYVFALAMVMFLACAAFGTALNHAAFGRT